MTRTFQYSLDENDFLQHQLFVASKSERIKKQRTRGWLIYTVSFFMLGFLFHQSENIVLAYYFSICGLTFLLFFPFYQNWYYKRHYQRVVIDNSKSRFGQIENLSFTDKFVEMSDTTGESKILLQEIENVTETGKYFYLKMKAAGHLIIPKSKIDNVDVVRNEFKELCKRLSINFASDLNWKWK